MMEQEVFKEIVFDHLAGLQGFRHRAMFGGYGLYKEDHIFGVIAGKLYFKTDATTVKRYLDAGMQAWRESKHYYEVPSHIFAAPEELVLWAEEAANVTAKTSRKKSVSKRKSASSSNV